MIIKFFTSRIERSSKKTMPNLVSGFTLVELMVATSIFVVIMLASMGSLFTLLDASKSSRALRFAMDNVNFAMESMSRSVRMGTNYYCAMAGDSVVLNDLSDTNVKDCTAAGSGTMLAFKPQLATTYKVAYKLSGSSIVISTDGGLNWVPITSSEVSIDRLRFVVSGSSATDSKQASVFIIVKGSVTVKGVVTSFAIQTLASQRNF